MSDGGSGSKASFEPNCCGCVCLILLIAFLIHPALGSVVSISAIGIGIASMIKWR